jgi:hypothetical protein
VLRQIVVIYVPRSAGVRLCMAPVDSAVPVNRDALQLFRTNKIMLANCVRDSNLNTHKISNLIYTS